MPLHASSLSTLPCLHVCVVSLTHSSRYFFLITPLLSLRLARPTSTSHAFSPVLLLPRLSRSLLTHPFPAPGRGGGGILQAGRGRTVSPHSRRTTMGWNCLSANSATSIVPHAHQFRCSFCLPGASTHFANPASHSLRPPPTSFTSAPSPTFLPRVHPLSHTQTPRISASYEGLLLHPISLMLVLRAGHASRSFAAKKKLQYMPWRRMRRTMTKPTGRKRHSRKRSRAL